MVSGCNSGCEAAPGAAADPRRGLSLLTNQASSAFPKWGCARAGEHSVTDGGWKCSQTYGNSGGLAHRGTGLSGGRAWAGAANPRGPLREPIGGRLLSSIRFDGRERGAAPPSPRPCWTAGPGTPPAQRLPGPAPCPRPTAAVAPPPAPARLSVARRAWSGTMAGSARHGRSRCWRRRAPRRGATSRQAGAGPGPGSMLWRRGPLRSDGGGGSPRRGECQRERGPASPTATHSHRDHGRGRAWRRVTREEGGKLPSSVSPGGRARGSPPAPWRSPVAFACDVRGSVGWAQLCRRFRLSPLSDRRGNEILDCEKPTKKPP